MDSACGPHPGDVAHSAICLFCLTQATLRSLEGVTGGSCREYSCVLCTLLCTLMCGTDIPVISSIFNLLASGTSLSVLLLVPFPSPSVPFLSCPLKCYLYPVSCPEYYFRLVCILLRCRLVELLCLLREEGGEEPQPAD